MGGGSGWAGDRISLRITVDVAVVDVGTASRAAAAVDVAEVVEVLVESAESVGVERSWESAFLHRQSRRMQQSE